MTEVPAGVRVEWAFGPTARKCIRAAERGKP